MRPNRAVLVGNGINLAAGLGPSWEDLVKGIFGLPPEGPHMQVTPFPLLIESAFSPHSAALEEESFQKALVEQLSGWTPGPLHHRLIGLDIDHVLTTNWDLTLEAAAGQVVSEKPFQKETRYSLFRRNILPSGLRVWHIHGSIEVPRTVVLGFEHYAGHLHVMRQAMVDVRRYKRRQFGPVVKRISN